MFQLEVLGKALRWLREDRGMKQDDVAQVAGITRPMLSAYERGRVQPTLDTLDRLLGALECDLTALSQALKIVNSMGKVGRKPLDEAGAAPARAEAGDRSRRDRARCGLCRPGAFQPRLSRLRRNPAGRVSEGRRGGPPRSGAAPVNFVQSREAEAVQSDLLSRGEEPCRSTRCFPISA